MGIPHTDENKLWLTIQESILAIINNFDSSIIWIETSDSSFKQFADNKIITCRLHTLFIINKVTHYDCTINTDTKTVIYNNIEYTINDDSNFSMLLTTINKLQEYNRLYFI